MGFFSKIAKGFKKALGFLGKTTGISSVLKGAKNIWNNLTGKTAAKDMAANQEAQLRQQSEAAKLNAANEMGNVTQFEDTSETGLGDNENRRKKRSAGSFGSGIGLVV